MNLFIMEEIFLWEKFGIHHSVVSRWVKRFEAEGIKGLEEKRGKAKGPDLGRTRTKPEVAYYKWIKRHAVPPKKQLADTAFKKKYWSCHTKLRGIYGYRRI